MKTEKEKCDICKKAVKEIVGYVDGMAYCSEDCFLKAQKKHRLDPIIKTKWKT